MSTTTANAIRDAILTVLAAVSGLDTVEYSLDARPPQSRRDGHCVVATGEATRLGIYRGRSRYRIDQAYTVWIAHRWRGKAQDAAEDAARTVTDAAVAALVESATLRALPCRVTVEAVTVERDRGSIIHGLDVSVVYDQAV